MIELQSAGLDHNRLRSAGRDLLSLALIDVRNRTLGWAAMFEGVPGDALGLGGELPLDAAEALDPPLWTLGHIGWFQERWIGRNVQRARGDAADPDGPRLASILPDADRFYDPASLSREARRALARANGLPAVQPTRQYLVDVLETTLELLDGLPDDADEPLYFHRLALFHEAMRIEGFAVLAQTLGITEAGPLVRRVALAAPRHALGFPATRWLLGSGSPGFAFAEQREPHPVTVPEFEIDAQPVTWSQYGEFVEDGGYDEAAHWSPDGWAWVERESRRTPRHVDQLRHGVLRWRFGQLVRVSGAEPAVHLTAHEAEAWCRWAGRRLPSEVEWEAAAHQGASRGFRWGDVWEWTASTLRPYPGYVAGPWREHAVPAFGQARVLRGSSIATPEAVKSARFRHFAAPTDDLGFHGFRSCAA